MHIIINIHWKAYCLWIQLHSYITYNSIPFFEYVFIWLNPVIGVFTGSYGHANVAVFY